MLLIVQTCSELTRIKLVYADIDDCAVLAIAQHCPKLAYLELCKYAQITYHALITLSEYKLPLEELAIPRIPNIPTDDIARCCSYALSCIRKLSQRSIRWEVNNTSIQFPYLTELTSVDLDNYSDDYIPLLAQHCHKLTKIRVFEDVTNILLLCRANPLLQTFVCYERIGITDKILIELIYACPHLHTLRLPYETEITDIGILAISKHCTQLQRLEIYNSHQVTEVAVPPLLQRCRKLTRLKLSKETLKKLQC